jgi:hypothetical protein
VRDGEEAGAGPAIEWEAYDPDKVRHHGAPTRRGVSWGIAVVTLLVGALGGYLVGVNRGSAGARPAPLPTATAALPAPITGTGGLCFRQTRTTLELGVEITNSSGASVILNRVDVLLPLGGLRSISSAWGNCGADPVADGSTPLNLNDGATTWVRETFEVQVPCPAAYPVKFTVAYTQLGRHGAAYIGGFNDLGGVSYSGCPSPS